MTNQLPSPAPRPRFVIDTNAIVGALFSRAPRSLLDYWREQRFDLVVTPPIEAEYRAIITRFQRLHPQAVPSFFEAVQAHALHAAEPEPLRLIRSDPEDNKFLDCAVAAEAEVLVSADHHLHDVQYKVRVVIERPGRVLRWLRERRWG